MKILTENRNSFFLIALLLIPILAIQYAFLLEQTSFLYPYFLLLVGILLIYYGYSKLIKNLHSYLCFKVLNDNEKYAFVTNISREKWFFSICGLILTLIGLKILFDTSFITFGSIHLYAIRNAGILFLIFIFSYVNNNFIETEVYIYPKVIDADNKSSSKDERLNSSVSREISQVIEGNDVVTNELQGIYEKSTNNSIVECSNIKVFNKILKGIQLDDNETFNFIYKHGKNHSIRDLIRYILIITNNAVQDAQKVNENVLIQNLILENNITINGKLILNKSINSSAISKARSNIEKSLIYKLILEPEQGQS